MKKKKDEWDNGMTVARMDGSELPQYRRAMFSGRPKRNKTEKEDVKKKQKEEYTKKEQRAMIGGMFAAMLPRILVIFAGFLLTYLLIRLWLT